MPYNALHNALTDIVNFYQQFTGLQWYLDKW